jgi:hypothetical protein
MMKDNRSCKMEDMKQNEVNSRETEEQQKRIDCV